MALFQIPKQRALYSDKAQVAHGMITDKATRDGRSATEYLVKVRFQDANGRAHEVENQYSYCLWTEIQPGQKVAVRYLTDDPEFAFADGARGGHKPNTRTDAMLLGGFALLGATCLTIGVRMRG